MVLLLYGREVCKAIFLCSIIALVMVVPLSIAGPEVHAQPCDILEFNPDYPANANPSQAIQVRTTVGVSCAQWRTYYTGRVDLVDSQSKSLLSISTFDIGWKPNVTATVANTATAPQTSGPWGLELHFYIFDGGVLVGSMNRSFNIQVAAVNVTTMQTTSNPQTTSVATTSTPSQPIVTAETNTGTTVASPMITRPTYFAAGALLAGALVAAVALILKARKRNA